MSIAYELPMFSRLAPRTAWTGSRMTDIDLLTLEDAAKFASKHAGTEITVNDFLLAAARGEIRLRAIVHRDAKVQKYDGGIYLNLGQPNENLIKKGNIPTLPVSACRQLANTGRASWRTIDGYEMINGEIMRYEIARLTDDEPDFETTLSDCRVIGYDVHALADEYIDAPKEADKPQAAPAKHIPKQRQQESVILDWLRGHYGDPKSLPKPPNGKRGPKAAARDALQSSNGLFQSKGVFDGAWERLRADKEIQDKE